MIEFDELVAEHGEWLRRLCWLLTLDHDDAAEVAQETLTRAWRDRDSLVLHPEPAAWLRRVALNLSFDRSRRRGARRRRGHLVAIDDSAPETTVEIDLHRAIARLSPRQRQAVVLRYWHDLDLTACADAMGVSTGSVKQHLSRAQAALAATPELAREDP
ncbi:MAG: sigma-70 family RNA polymerase sigma factor [Actinomycetota bacterium]